MSLDEKSYLKRINLDRIKLHDATIKIEVKSKPQDSKLCTNCHQSLMKPYLQPPSRFVDENGIDNAGFKANAWYYKCENMICNYKELMPTQQETTKKGYRTKNTVVSRLPLWLGEPGNPSGSRKPRMPRGLNDKVSEEDKDDITNYFGYTPQSISYEGR